MITPTNKPQVIFDAPKGTYRLEYDSGVDGRDDWAIIYPTNSKTWVVNIHGYGGHADQLFTHHVQRDLWLPEILHKGLSLLCPNLRDSSWMSPAAAADLKDLLDYIRQIHNAERFIFFGGDMGATCNLIYAALQPQDVACCGVLSGATDLTGYYNWCRQQNQPTAYEIANSIAIAYDGSPYSRAAEYHRNNPAQNIDKLTMPILLIHGAKDQHVPVVLSRDFADNFDNKNFEYRELPDMGHDGPYSATDSLQWLLHRL